MVIAGKSIIYQGEVFFMDEIERLRIKLNAHISFDNLSMTETLTLSKELDDLMLSSFYSTLNLS